MKSIAKASKMIALWEREGPIMLSLNSPFVARAITWFETDSDVNLIMEYYEKGSLDDLMKKNAESGTQLPQSVSLLSEYQFFLMFTVF